MGKLKVDGNYLVHESGRRSKSYITHKTRNSGHIGDLTAVAKSVILQEHALSKNNSHELLAEPKINKYIKYHIANQNSQEAKGILKNIFKTIYSKISSEQHEESQSHEPPKTKIEAIAFLSYEANLVIYDINEKGYDGLVHIELAAP